MINKKAAELYLLSKNEHDVVELILSVISIAKDSPDSLLSEYRDIVNGKTKVVEIASAKELSSQQKHSIEKTISSGIKEKTIFIYSINKNLLGGYKVILDDNVFDNSMLKKIREMEIK
jgi:F0F1-type ATP synthase delta subunit